MGKGLEVLLEPKVTVGARLLGGGAGRVREWMMRNEKERGKGKDKVEKSEKKSALERGRVASCATDVDVDGDAGAEANKVEQDGDDEDVDDEGFFVITVLLSAGRLLPHETVPRRLDGTFKLRGISR